VVGAFPNRFQLIGLAAGRNIDLLSLQVKEFHPKLISFQESKNKEQEMENLFPIPRPSFLELEEMASHPEVDLVVVATPGKEGLLPTLAAIRAKKSILLADKAVLVMAGEIVTSQASHYGVDILPLDSEHNAIWQCLKGEEQGIKSLILTCSGGPFRNYTRGELISVTPEEALKHPVWKMGRNITIDSATLMNKGMEVIEAHWLFNMPFENIEVIIHSESIVHSMVEFVDGLVKATLGPADMRLPIQYALFYPERVASPEFPKLDWRNIRSLTFEAPDFERFPCLKLAIEAGKRGGTYPAVLCAADEVAVELFLSHRIGFLDITEVVKRVINQHQAVSQPQLEEILTAWAWAKEYAQNLHLG
jgi:1-deoxy-D-xylulose-5-phosphate reductoisomerase